MEAEKKLRTAVTPAEKIEIYEELLRLIPKHKGTEKMVAQHRSKIAKLKEEQQKAAASGKHGVSYHHRQERRRASHPGRAAELGQVIADQSPDRGRGRGGRLSLHDPRTRPLHDEVRERQGPARGPAPHHRRVHGELAGRADQGGRRRPGRGRRRGAGDTGPARDALRPAQGQEGRVRLGRFCAAGRGGGADLPQAVVPRRRQGRPRSVGGESGSPQVLLRSPAAHRPRLRRRRGRGSRTCGGGSSTSCGSSGPTASRRARRSSSPTPTSSSAGPTSWTSPAPCTRTSPRSWPTPGSGGKAHSAARWSPATRCCRTRTWSSCTSDE